YIARRRPDVRTTLELFLRVCQAVEYAHRNGVVHRDLKPANVLIDEECNPHILDFGLAKATDQAEYEDALTKHPSAPGQVMGTLRYLSPEQAAGLPAQVDVRTDVYALGAMLYEALTSALPYDTRGRPAEVVRRILEAPPIAPSSISERINNELETILLQSLDKEQDRRYQSVGQMGEDLRRYLNGEAILAKRASRLYVLRKKLVKHRARIALMAAALALALVGVWGGTWWAERSLAHQRRTELIAARRHLLRIQRTLEAGYDVDVLAAAYLALGRYPTVAEAPLVVAQAKYEHALHRPSSEDEDDEDQEPYGPIVFLKDQLLRSEKQWACRALLAAIYRERAAQTDLELEHIDLDSDEQADLRKFAEADRARAEKLGQQVQEEFHDTAEGWYLRSFTALYLDESLRCVREGVNRDPAHALAWERLTYLSQQTGDLDRALDAVEHLKRLAPQSTEWEVLGEYILTKRREAAAGAEATDGRAPRGAAIKPNAAPTSQPAGIAVPREAGTPDAPQ
ncbi:MAG: protein kinase domain-containing protein, partial [Planctomycetota bacterium]